MEKTHKIGRRKSSIARVYIKKGKGLMTINNREINNYFSTEELKNKVNKPFLMTETTGKYDTTVTVHGGGNTGQADAIKLAISRALCELNENYKPILKKEGLLTRDSRVVERKKPGQKKARKKFQWVKR